MINCSSHRLREIFDKNKKSIINEFINYYGEEYAGMIKEKINDTYFDFSSTPDEEYQYSKVHKKDFDSNSLLEISSNFQNFIDAKIRARSNATKQLLNFLKNDLCIILPEDAIAFTIFSDLNFNEGAIDSFSSESIKILNNENTPSTIKENIKRQQDYVKDFLEYRNIKMSLSPRIIDLIVKYRKKTRESYRKDVILNSNYGKRLQEEFTAFHNFSLSDKTLTEIAYTKNPWAGRVSDDLETFYSYIKLPLFYLANNDIKGLDISLIHELIHRVETEKLNVGIESYHFGYKDNQIINEIRTQLLAIKITKNLHEQGVYIFDDPKKCVLVGESAYEILFPISKEFIEVYEELFTECAINNNPHKINKTFGPTWSNYSTEIDNKFKEMVHDYQKNRCFQYVDVDSHFNELINNMVSYDKGGARHV